MTRDRFPLKCYRASASLWASSRKFYESTSIYIRLRDSKFTKNLLFKSWKVFLNRNLWFAFDFESFEVWEKIDMGMFNKISTFQFDEVLLLQKLYHSHYFEAGKVKLEFEKIHIRRCKVNAVTRKLEYHWKLIISSWWMKNSKLKEKWSRHGVDADAAISFYTIPSDGEKLFTRFRLTQIILPHVRLSRLVCKKVSHNANLYLHYPFYGIGFKYILWGRARKFFGKNTYYGLVIFTESF